MRIDSHVHFWRYRPREYAWIDDSMSVLRRDFLPEDARREMEDAEIDGCIAVQARQTLEETGWLLDLADAHPFIAGVIGWVDLTAGDAAAQLKRFSDRRKFAGVRHILQGESDDRFMLRPDFCRGLALLQDFDLTYDLLIYPRHLPFATQLVSQFPRQRFVLDHLAKPAIRSGALDEWERDLRRLSSLPNVCAKVSGLVTEAEWTSWTIDQIRPCLDIAFDCFGVDRIVAGSDWPVCTLAAGYRRVIAMIDDYVAERSRVDRDAVMGGNALRLWKLH